MPEPDREPEPRGAEGSARPVAGGLRVRRAPGGAGTHPAGPHPRPESHRPGDPADAGPAVVALGGGHGLAAALRAVRTYAGSVTAVVSVADDGGSSGRLRRDLGIPPPGDLRKALVALADPDSPWTRAFEHRFAGGDLDGHALGNIVIAGMAETLGGFEPALEEAGRLLGAVGRVLPATTDPVVLKADVDGRSVEGQVAVATSRGRIRRVELVPSDPAAAAGATAALELADQVVLAPGSLYTSLLAVLCVPGIREAVAAARGRVVQVCNLRPQVPETEDLDATDHVRAVLEHGGRVDALVVQEPGDLRIDEAVVRELGVEPVPADVARADRSAHDPARLASVLRALL